MDAGELVIKTSLDNKDFTVQIKETERELEKLEKRFEETKSLKPYKGQKEDLEQLAREAENTRNKLVGLYKQQNKINEQGFSKASSSLKNISKGLTNVVKTVGKWALAIFAVRSIYTGIRQIISQVSQYNDQVKADLDYMKYAIAMSLTPVVEYLDRLFYSILENVKDIIYNLSGFNIFANSSADGFKKANKEAKELKKTLDKAGFDEFTALNDNKGGGTQSPQFDLSQNNEIMVKGVGETLDKIIKMYDTTMEKIKTNVTKVLKSIGFSDLLIGSVRQTMYGIQNVVEGVLKAIGGAIDLAIGLMTGNTDMVIDAFIRLVDGIGQILWGIVNHWTGMTMTLFSIIHDTFVRPVINLFGTMYDSIVSVFGKIGTFFVNTFTNAWTKIKKLFSTGGQIFVGIKDGIVNTFKTIVNALITGINTAIQTPFNKLNTLLNDIRSVSVLGVKPFNKLWGKNPISIPKIPKLARGGIVNNPGAGVMMGNYIAGESGREAVVPLTDPSALREIGMAIGRYITINNVVENYMDSRRINRVLQQSRNSDMMANNGGVV